MLYSLFEWLKSAGIKLPGSALFQFITFRVLLAVLFSLIVSMIFGKRLINFLLRKQVGETVRKVAALDPAASLNLLLTDGSRILGVTWGDGLSHLVEDDGVVVASEPYDDDPRWVDVPDRHLIEVTLGEGTSRPVVTVTALES